LGEFPDNQRFDVRARGLFVFGISANIANVRVSEADNLPRVTWVGEYFLIAGETGIENDFSAAARDRAGRAAVKYAPVLERQNCGSMQNFGQCVLRCSFFLRFGGCRKRAKVIHGPIRKNRAAINKPAGDRTKNSRIV